MRNLLVSTVAWLGMLQSWQSVPPTTEQLARLVGIASVLGTLTVFVYRLGVWRQEMENTRHNVGAEVKAHREESAANFGRIERRLEAIDHILAGSEQHRARTGRWQA